MLLRSETVLNMSISSLTRPQSVGIQFRSGKIARSPRADVSKQSKPVRSQFKPVLNLFYLVPNTS